MVSPWCQVKSIFYQRDARKRVDKLFACPTQFCQPRLDMSLLQCDPPLQPHGPCSTAWPRGSCHILLTACVTCLLYCTYFLSSPELIRVPAVSNMFEPLVTKGIDATDPCFLETWIWPCMKSVYTEEPVSLS